MPKCPSLPHAQSSLQHAQILPTARLSPPYSTPKSSLAHAQVLPTACPNAPPCCMPSPPYSMPKSQILLPAASLSPPYSTPKSSLQHAQVPPMPALHSACINSNAQGQAVLCDEYCLSGGLRKCLACGFQKQWVTLSSGR